MEFDRVVSSASHLAQVGVVIGNDARLVADIVVDVLQTVFAQELIAGLEGDLDDGAEFGEFFGGVVLDIGNALKVSDKLLGDSLPGSETFDEDVAGPKFMRGGVLLDQGLVS